jgi:hypothetical protein
MAKGKHAAALFEVIHKGNSLEQPSRRRGGAPKLGLPKWWANRAERRAEAAPPPTHPAPGRESRSGGHAGAASSFFVDRHERTFSLRLSYRAAALSAIGALAVLTIAFSVGRRMGQSPSPLLSLSTEQLRAGPARPQVLEIGDAQNSPAAAALPVHQVSRRPASPPAHTVSDTKRSFGLNYVVIQSYLKPEAAQEARDLLIKHNILCTVEKNLPHYGSKGWYSVVGLTGFDRIRGVKEYQNYINAINRVSSLYDAKIAGFKKLDPQPYKWR